MPGDRELRLLLEQLDPGEAGTFTWLDPRNASLALLPETAAVPVQVHLPGIAGQGQDDQHPTDAQGRQPEAEEDAQEKASHDAQSPRSEEDRYR